jgi:hypothetical protein
MKKNIILGVAFMIMSLHQLAAQDSAQVSPSVSKRFEATFEGAKNVQWEFLPKKVTQARFVYQGSGWLAYFDQEGKLLTSGRRIKSTDDLPLNVQSGLRRAKSRFEKKSGAAQLGLIYEMVQNDITRYYITMESSAIRALFSVNTDGTAMMESKSAITKEPATPKDAIAKKN